MPRLAKRLHDRSVRIRDQDGVGRLVFRDASVRFGRGELRIGRVRRGLRLLVALFGSPSVVDQIGVSPLICVRLNDSCARCGHGVALRRKRKAQIGFVDPHQRFAGFDLLTDIYQPFDDLAGERENRDCFPLSRPQRR
ncbi:hypothetical protein ACVWWG_000880 [Bradyrhizobium sp. LB7.2]